MNTHDKKVSQNEKFQDTDGIPPGLDLAMVGKEGFIKFTGIFYAMPHLGETVLVRKVRIIFASTEVYVAQDIIARNLYVVDRSKNLSLGCRMTAEFLSAQELLVQFAGIPVHPDITPIQA